jgi:hypothetical protein
MKRQKITPASLTSPATNSHIKGLQQYFTPEPWAAALGSALPQYRRTILDPFCGNGSLLRGLANDTTRDGLGLDLDPTGSLGGPKAGENRPAANARREMAHGDVLDLLPLLEETGTKFDLVALNPPFSLEWPVALLPESVRKGQHGTISSTLATLRIAPTLLTPRGEAILIANDSTIERIHEKSPGDFHHVWLRLSIPSFYSGTDPSLRIAVLFLTGKPLEPHQRFREDLGGPVTPDQLAEILDAARHRHFSAPCIDEPWLACRDSARAFLNCTDEMERRRNPGAAPANVVLDANGKLRTWVSAFQERSFNIPKHLADFLRKINRSHPIELTIQPATRAALTESIQSGIWTIDPPALAAIHAALTAFAIDRAPLAPVSQIQRLGWIDDTETLLCTTDFHDFKAGQRYPLSSQTLDWSKETLRPRYHAGKRSKETILTKGTDLRITIHHGHAPHSRHFTFNPANPTGEGHENCHTLGDLADHFHIPEVPDITSLHPDRYAQNLALIDDLEDATP